MTEEERLEALKIDLGITATAYDARLKQYLIQAEKEIEGEGVTLTLSDFEDSQTVVQYAGWLWRKRDTQEGMPRMVRYHLNNLIMHQHSQES